MNVVIGNWGNETIALLSWCVKNQLRDVYLLTVNTGWQSTAWQSRVEKGMQWAAQNAIHVITLTPALSFAQMIKHRGAFPTPSFLWCADTLKKVPILKWLTEHDSRCEATILLPSIQALSSRPYGLFDEESARDHYDDRHVTAPLWALSQKDCQTLAAQTDCEWLTTRSQECAPCVKSSLKELQSQDKESISKLALLEKEVGHTLCKNFHGEPIAIEEYLQEAAENHAYLTDSFELSCSDYFGCRS